MKDNGVFFSIKPEFVQLIAQKRKNFEFRKYIPKKQPEMVIIYSTSPVCEIRYIAIIDTIVTYPSNIPENGYGNIDFNLGKKKSKFAYHISKLYELNDPINLSTLRTYYSFSPPQSYAYLEKYKDLAVYISQHPKTLLWTDNLDQ